MQWEFSTSTAEQTQQLAANLAVLLRAGDLLILSGELGAGKTTFTQGLGRSLGVRTGIISPTFVLVRIHPNMADGPNPGGPDLVHVDAYRLGTAAEIDDIDLENTLDTSVTVVEWGQGLVEHLSENRLEIALIRAVGSESIQEPASQNYAGEENGEEENDDEPRVLRLRCVGPRWLGVDFSGLALVRDQLSAAEQHFGDESLVEKQLGHQHSDQQQKES